MNQLNGRSDRPIARWLMIGVAMIIIQILLGGITRLTGSGLSITEWDLGRGSLPPLNQQQWLKAFDNYKHTEQFRQLNSGFTLSDFKFIFFWEWFHRLWGRLIGVVFAIPFIVFLIQKRFRNEMVIPLVILFLLGALQGAVGWIMVASGLTGDAVYVRPTKLAMHFVLALVLLCYTYWFALKFYIKQESLAFQRRLRNLTWIVLIVLFVQLFYGALMAGYKAAPYAPTWPDINGQVIPSFSGNAPGMEERALILQTHFIHRGLAYTLVVLLIIWTWQAGRMPGSRTFQRSKWMPLLAVLAQTTLGVLTVLSSVGIRVYRWDQFEWMAQLHQLTAIFLLLSLVRMLFLLTSEQKLNS